MAKFAIAVDIGGTKTKIALVGKEDSRILFKDVLSTGIFKNKNELISYLTKKIDEIIEKMGIRKSDVHGLGIGLPGPVDYSKGLVRYLPNISGWRNVPLGKILLNRTGLPTFIDNDANLAALAEYRLGAGRIAKDLICITLGTGIGGGLILDGRLYRGWQFSAGEIGHLPLNEKGPRCNCGGLACLERYVGNEAILKEARLKTKDRKITLERLSRLARAGDKDAIEVWKKVGSRLGLALAAAANLLNLKLVVIGGGVADAGKVLFDSVRRTIDQRAMNGPAKRIKLRKAKLGNDAGLMGAAILVWEGRRL
jgi:glucokinase